MLGNGSNDVLDLAARAFLTPADEAIYSQHAFAVYPLAVQAIGARGIEVPARDYGHDLDAMARAVTDRTRLVFIANPNNPTGTFVPSGRARIVHRGVARRTCWSCSTRPTTNICRTKSGPTRSPGSAAFRTWSSRARSRRSTALPGLRVGYAFASHEVADLMNRVREPFNVNSVALAAAAAALDDADFVRKSYELNLRGMKQITEGLTALGLDYIPSYGNFVSFKVQNAPQVFQRLLEAGVIVRPIAGYGMPEHLRVSIGLESENARFLESLQQAIA